MIIKKSTEFQSSKHLHMEIQCVFFICSILRIDLKHPGMERQFCQVE